MSKLHPALPSIPDYIVWVVRNTRVISPGMLSYKFPFNDLRTFPVPNFSVKTGDVVNPLTGTGYFTSRQDAVMIYGDLPDANNWVVTPCCLTKTVKEVSPTSLVQTPFRVGQRVRVIGPLKKDHGGKSVQETCPITGGSNHFVERMYRYIGQEFIVSSVSVTGRILLKENGWEYLSCWLEIVEEEVSSMVLDPVVPVHLSGPPVKKTDSFHVGQYVRIDLTGYEYEQEYCGKHGSRTWLITEMRDYDGKVFRIEDVLAADKVIICGYEWLSQWLKPIDSTVTDYDGDPHSVTVFEVGDRVRINFPKEHLLEGRNDSGLDINMCMHQRQGDLATITKVVNKSGRGTRFRLKFDKRAELEDSWLWCSTWLEKA